MVRTLVVPLSVGLLTQNAVLFVVADIGFLLRSTIFIIAAALYYFVARLLQQRWPLLGFLLLVAAEPYYLDNEQVDETDRLMISVQRTAVPLAFGWIIAQLGLWVFEFSQSVGLVVMSAATALFYGALRWVEERSVAGTKQRVVAGCLLGSPTVPVY